MDVQVDPEEEQRPEENREDRAEDWPPAPEMFEVVLLRGEATPTITQINARRRLRNMGNGLAGRPQG